MGHPLFRTVFLAAVGFLAAPVSAQEGAPPADAADVATVNGIIAAVYASISGPAGEPRDWARFRSLFVPEARLIPSWRESSGEEFRQLVMSPEEYIQRFGSQLEDGGFFENEIHRVEERYGPIAHAFSTYESRRRVGEEPFARGINSFQLFWDGARWWIVDVYWFGETPGHPIPARYLPGG